MEGLGGIGGDEEEGAVVVRVFPGVFDGGAGLADAAHTVDGALAFDDDGACGGEVLAEFGEKLIAAFEQGAGEMTNLEFRVSNAPTFEALRHSDFCIRTSPGAVGVPAVLGELGDEGLLPLGQIRWLGSEGCEPVVSFVALGEEGVDGASEVAGDEEFELGVGEEAVLRARVLESVDGLLRLRDGIVRPGAIRGADEADDGIALLKVLGHHAFDVMRGRVEARLDDRLDAPLSENLGASFRESCQPGGGAGDEDAGLTGGGAHAA